MLLHLQTPRSHRLRFLAGQSVTLGLADGEDVRAEPPDRELPLRRPQPALLHRAQRRRPDGDAPVRRRRSSPATPSRVWGPSGDFVLAEDAAPARLRRLRHRLRAGQEPDRARAVARRRAVDRAVLAGDAARRPLPGQPVPRLVGGARQLRSHAVDARRRRHRAPARWPRRSAPTCSTSTAPSTSPGPAAFVDSAARRARCRRRAACADPCGGDRMSPLAASDAAAGARTSATSGAAAAPNRSRCTCSATTWRPSSTTARSSSSSPTAR